MNTNYDILIIGGGAAGFFTAINVAERLPKAKIGLMERGKEVLTKVKISGGGRCNVTHAQFDPKELSRNYPRGEKELLGPFHSFMTGDTIDWFEKRGVPLKIEEDGRMFPVSDSSQTIIDCFLSEVERLSIHLIKNCSVRDMTKSIEGWDLKTTAGDIQAKQIVVASGSNPKIWNLMSRLGHTIIPPVPSLFTFNIKDERIADLPGIATEASVKVMGEHNKIIIESEGPLLITHWGLSGPAILKLSAWGARLLEPTNYHFSILVNWLLHWTQEDTFEHLLEVKERNPKQTVMKYPQCELPKRLWKNLVKSAGIDSQEVWASMSHRKIQNLSLILTQSHFEVSGKSTFKEEFVTAGGIDLKEVNFKTFESKKLENVYFAGEVLNVDAITGGFNFQNAWTSAYMVAKAISQKS